MVIMPDSAQQATTCPRHDRVDIVSSSLAQHRRLEDLSSPLRASSDQEREGERERKREREGERERERERDAVIKIFVLDLREDIK